MVIKRKPRSKLSLLKPNLQDSIENTKFEEKLAADRNHSSYRDFVEGEKVLVKTVWMEKLSWVPRVIALKVSPVTYSVMVLGKYRFCHVDNLRKSQLWKGQNQRILHCYHSERVYVIYGLSRYFRRSKRVVKQRHCLNLWKQTIESDMLPLTWRQRHAIWCSKTSVRGRVLCI